MYLEYVKLDYTLYNTQIGFISMTTDWFDWNHTPVSIEISQLQKRD